MSAKPKTDRLAYWKAYNARPEVRARKSASELRNRSKNLARMKQRRADNKEHWRQYWKDYRKKRPGLYRKYLQRNPEKAAQKKAALVEWCKNNGEKRRAASRRCHAKNRDKRNAAAREYRKSNHETVALWAKKTRLKHRDKINAGLKAYYRKRYDSDPAFRLAFKLASDRRRALKKGAEVNPASIKIFVSAVKKKVFAVCFYCQKRVSTKRVWFDHIVPLSKGGPHSVENLCVACQPCNRDKSDKYIKDWLTLGQQLLEL